MSPKRPKQPKTEMQKSSRDSRRMDNATGRSSLTGFHWLENQSLQKWGQQHTSQPAKLHQSMAQEQCCLTCGPIPSCSHAFPSLATHLATGQKLGSAHSWSSSGCDYLSKIHLSLPVLESRSWKHWYQNLQTFRYSRCQLPQVLCEGLIPRPKPSCSNPWPALVGACLLAACRLVPKAAVGLVHCPIFFTKRFGPFESSPTGVLSNSDNENPSPDLRHLELGSIQHLQPWDVVQLFQGSVDAKKHWSEFFECQASDIFKDH